MRLFARYILCSRSIDTKYGWTWTGWLHMSSDRGVQERRENSAAIGVVVPVCKSTCSILNLSVRILKVCVCVCLRICLYVCVCLLACALRKVTLLLHDWLLRGLVQPLGRGLHIYPSAIPHLLYWKREPSNITMAEDRCQIDFKLRKCTLTWSRSFSCSHHFLQAPSSSSPFL